MPAKTIKPKKARRVNPQFSRLLIQWINKYGYRVEYKKEPGDTYTTFYASAYMMEKVTAFIDGCTAGANPYAGLQR